MTPEEQAGRRKILIVAAAVVAPPVIGALASLLLGAEIGLGLLVVGAVVGLVLGWFLYQGRSTARYYLIFTLALNAVRFVFGCLAPPYTLLNVVWLLVAVFCGGAAWALLKSTDIDAFFESRRRGREPVLSLTDDGRS
ncbi:MAG TPA: hypothetical protein VFG76_11955 [Candidatus Polarisedimenticolia bacterium]|nr:hypothetical protein [Candidatus Polarisedimenticolia bacterium]